MKHIVKFQGGFANQLFQFCLYLKLKELYRDDRILADISYYHFNNDHGGFKLDKIFDIDYINEREIDRTTIITEAIFECRDMRENVDSLYYDGYWQDERFFPSDLSEVVYYFDNLKLDDRNTAYLDMINGTSSVAIHVRKGDYTNHYLHGNIANKTYYNNAIEYVGKALERPTFFVFSDDIEWCKANLCFAKSQLVFFIEGNESQVHYDLFLMSRCKNIIMSNSSFSWWASYLNRTYDCLIVKPEYWFNDSTISKDLIVRNSVTVPNVPIIDEIKDPPFFSVLVPVFNRKHCIRRCLASILNQSYKKFEVIIVDDGSTDGTADIITEYSNRDNRIRIIKNETNQSIMIARARALKKAEGEYIVFVDSDDYIDLNMFQTLYDELQQDKCDILEYAYDVVFSKNHYMKENAIEDRVKGIITGELNNTLWNKCYSKKIVSKTADEIVEFRCNMSEDVYISMILAYFAGSYVYFDKPLYFYVNKNGITRPQEVSEKKIRDLIHSINGAYYYIKEFLDHRRPDLVDYVNSHKQADFDYHISLYNDYLNNDIYDRFQVYCWWDKYAGTDYLSKYNFIFSNGEDIYKKIYLEDKLSGAKTVLKIFLDNIFNTKFYK